MHFLLEVTQLWIAETLLRGVTMGSWNNISSQTQHPPLSADVAVAMCDATFVVVTGAAATGAGRGSGAPEFVLVNVG